MCCGGELFTVSLWIRGLKVRGIQHVSRAIIIVTWCIMLVDKLDAVILNLGLHPAGANAVINQKHTEVSGPCSGTMIGLLQAAAILNKLEACCAE